ncbi:MAG: hypothetical protein ACOCW4_01050 [bacterium]
MVKEVLYFIDMNQENPFFLYLALTIPLANGEAGKEGQEVPDYGIYADKDWPEPQKGTAAMTSHTNAYVGSIMSALKGIWN